MTRAADDSSLGASRAAFEAAPNDRVAYHAYVARLAETGNAAALAQAHERYARVVVGDAAVAAWIAAGEAWERSESVARALACYQRAFQANPDAEAAAEALRRGRQIYAARENWEMVGELLVLEIQTGPERENKAARWVELGDVAREQLNDLARAMSCYEAALRLDPANEAARSRVSKAGGTWDVEAVDPAALVAEADAATDNELAALLCVQAGRELMRRMPAEPLAEVVLRKALARVPGHPAAVATLRSWYEKNERWVDLGRMNEARREGAGAAAGREDRSRSGARPRSAGPGAAADARAGAVAVAVAVAGADAVAAAGADAGAEIDALEQHLPGSVERVSAVRALATTMREKKAWRALRDLLDREANAIHGDAQREERAAVVLWLIELADLYAGPLEDAGFEIGALERASEIDPANRVVLGRLAARFEEHARPRDEFRVLKKMAALDGSSPSPLLLRRLADLALGPLADRDEAILALETLRQIQPADRDVEARLIATLRDAGYWDRVVEIALDRFESGGSSRDEFRALVTTADEKGLRDELKASAYQTLLDADDRDDEAFERLVALDLAANRCVRAAERLAMRAKEAAVPGDRASLLSRAGGVLLNRLARPAEAEAAFAESFSLAPEDGPAFRALVDFAWRRADVARVVELFGRLNDDEGLVAELKRVVHGAGSGRTRVKAALELARREAGVGADSGAREAALRFVWESREARAFERVEAARGLASHYKATREPVAWVRFLVDAIGVFPADEAARRLLEITEACGDTRALEPLLIEALRELPVEAAYEVGHEVVAVIAAIERCIHARSSANEIVAWIDDAVLALRKSQFESAGIRVALEGIRARLLHRVAGRGEEALLALERLSVAAVESKADDALARVDEWIATARAIGDAASLARALAARVISGPAEEAVVTLRHLAELWETELRDAEDAESERVRVYERILRVDPGDSAAALKLSERVAALGDDARAVATLQGALERVADDAGRRVIAAELFGWMARAGDWDQALRLAEAELGLRDTVGKVFQVAADALVAHADPVVSRRFVAWAQKLGWDALPADTLAQLYGAARSDLNPATHAELLTSLLAEEMAVRRERQHDLSGAFDVGLALARLRLDGALLEGLIADAERLGRFQDVATVAEASLSRPDARDALIIHRELAGLYETRLRDPRGAIRHRRAVIAAAGDDWASWVALARLAEETEAWGDLREILRHLTGMNAEAGAGAEIAHERERVRWLERLLALELDILRDGARAIETARVLVDAVPDHLGAWRTIVRLLGETPPTPELKTLRHTALRRLRILEAGLPADGRLSTLLALGQELSGRRETANEAALALVEAAEIAGAHGARDRLEELLNSGWLDGAAERAALRACGHRGRLAELLENDVERANSEEAILILKELLTIYATEGDQPDALRRALRRQVALAPTDAALRAKYLEVVEAAAAWDEYIETAWAAAEAMPDDNEEVWGLMVDLYVIASRESPDTEASAKVFAAVVARARAAFVRDGVLPIAAQKALQSILEVARPSATRTEAVKTLVESFVRAGEPKHAAEVLQRAIERAADEREAAAWLAALADLCATRLDRGETAAGLFVDAGELWLAVGESAKARGTIERALPLASGEGLARAHVALGNALRGDSARELDAVLHYDAALDLLARVESRAPFSTADDLVPFRRIDEILTARRDWKPLERAYRHMIARVAATKFKPLLVLLWRNLGEIYRSRLDDAERAVQAFEVVVGLAPGDEAAKKILDALRAKKL
ncbi:MAG: hypothetical protein HYY84_15870 [Deltaproteobacteria bacterium]|nr:hypothetical protein [Deltaproteobacteria bacterium]